MSNDHLPEGVMRPGDPDVDHGPDGHEAPGNRRIVVTVFAPREPDPRKLRFSLDTTVGVAAATAATEFGYDAGGTPSFRSSAGVVLDRNVTLEASGVHHKEELELVEAGGGV